MADTGLPASRPLHHDRLLYKGRLYDVITQILGTEPRTTLLPTSTLQFEGREITRRTPQAEPTSLTEQGFNRIALAQHQALREELSAGKLDTQIIFILGDVTPETDWHGIDLDAKTPVHELDMAAAISSASALPSVQAPSRRRWWLPVALLLLAGAVYAAWLVGQRFKLFDGSQRHQAASVSPPRQHSLDQRHPTQQLAPTIASQPPAATSAAVAINSRLAAQTAAIVASTATQLPPDPATGIRAPETTTSMGGSRLSGGKPQRLQFHRLTAPSIERNRTPAATAQSRWWPPPSRLTRSHRSSRIVPEPAAHAPQDHDALAATDTPAPTEVATTSASAPASISTSASPPATAASPATPSAASGIGAIQDPRPVAPTSPPVAPERPRPQYPRSIPADADVLAAAANTPQARRRYALLQQRCTICHSTERIEKAVRSGIAPISGGLFEPSEIQNYLIRMLRKRGSQLTREETREIFSFLVHAWNRQHKPDH